ncbi:hypothetical protein PLESTM_001741000 [Pleodorina starrii]|nr:hypothetical protein PLESTM_001741000 [Pleodorina starrii]
MLKWAEEYDGVYRMEIVGRKYVVVADPALMAPIMGRGCPGLPKSEGYAMWDPVISPHPGVQGIVTVSENTEIWRTVRRSYGPAMGLASLGRYYPVILRCAMEEAGARGRNPARRLLPWLFEGEAREGQAAMDAYHAAVEAVWRDIQSRGPPADDDTSFAAQLARLADPALGSAALSDAQICAEIATVMVAGYETTANTMTWLLFALHAYPEAAARLEEELRLAGLIPSDAEVDGAGGVGDPSLDAFLSLPGGHETISSLPYLDAFVREGLRLFSVAPNGAVKRVPEGGPPARIGPYDVEPGTTVWVPFWSVHLSERNWERPLEFEPERWMNQNPRTGFPTTTTTTITTTTTATSRCPVFAAVGAFRAAAEGGGDAASSVGRNASSSNSSSSGGGNSNSSGGNSSSSSVGNSSSGGGGSKATRYMPFSDGSRNCVGQHLGMLQIKVVLSYLVSRFRVRLDEQRMGGVARTLERQRVNLTLEVAGGMWMVLEPRRRWGRSG